MFPLVFVGISFFFRSLQNIDPYTELNDIPFTPSLLVDGIRAHELLPYAVNVT